MAEASSSSSSLSGPTKIVRNFFRHIAGKSSGSNSSQNIPKPTPQKAYIQCDESPPESRLIPQTAYIQGATTSADTLPNFGNPERPTTPKNISPQHENGEVVYTPQKIDASANSLHVLADFVNKTASKGIDGLKKEYAKVDKFIDTSATFESFRVNMDKNRYSDVLCPDATRVKLTFGGPEYREYIHANIVNDPVLPQNSFICTQGPTKETAHDFWRMVYQHRVENIIMLCNPVEEGKIKCAYYWPDSEEKINEYPTLIIKNVSVTEDEFTITKLTVEINPASPNAVESAHPSDPLEVTLIRWISWPDRGIPSKQCQTILPFILLDKVRGSKTIIHCSAGIGRTGCLMALEIAHERISKGKKVDFEQIVRDLRCQRAQCIQTEIQYLYIYRVVVEYAYRHANLDANALDNGKKFIDEYERKLRK